MRHQEEHQQLVIGNHRFRSMTALGEFTGVIWLPDLPSTCDNGVGNFISNVSGLDIGRNMFLKFTASLLLLL